MGFARKVLISGLVTAATILSLCGPVNAGFFDAFQTNNNIKVDNSVANYYNTTYKHYEIKMDSNAYEAEGKKWGEKLYNNNKPALKPEDGVDGPTSRAFIYQLIVGTRFFDVHPDLKDAFKKGFREGYPDRIADLVLGPHLQQAAGIIGYSAASGFVKVINDFEIGWRNELSRSIDMFITLISEGSQADREEFTRNFVYVYKKKFTENQNIIHKGAAIRLMSEGGTNLFLDPSKTQSTLDIPSDEAIKNEIYKQTFRVMGDEMGRRYSHNLIPRGELVEWLRRSKTALNMDIGKEVDSKRVAQNLGIIARAFEKSYETDGKSVFEGLAKEAGYGVVIAWN